MSGLFLPTDMQARYGFYTGLGPMLNSLLKDKPMRWTRCVICILYFIPLLSWGKVAMAAVEFSPVPSCAEPVSSAVTGLHVNYL